MRTALKERWNAPQGLTLNRTQLDWRAAVQSTEPETCSIDGCERPITFRARLWCNRHYMRWYHHGDPLGGGPARREMGIGVNKAEASAAYFWSRVDKSAACWIWTGCIVKTGYGNIKVGGQIKLTHRYAYELAKGPIPNGLVIDHLCSVRACVNPDHLEAVTDEENRRRGLSYGIVNGRRDTCANGHPITEDSYRPRMDGVRARSYCRICKAAADRAYYQRRKGDLEGVTA